MTATETARALTQEEKETQAGRLLPLVEKWARLEARRLGFYDPEECVSVAYESLCHALNQWPGRNPPASNSDAEVDRFVKMVVSRDVLSYVAKERRHNELKKGLRDEVRREEQ